MNDVQSVEANHDYDQGQYTFRKAGQSLWVAAAYHKAHLNQDAREEKQELGGDLDQ